MAQNLAASRWWHLTAAQFACCVLIFGASAMLSGVPLRYAWNGDWMPIAFFWTLIYSIGVVRLMPWGTPYQKALSIGIFAGTAIPVIEWAIRWGVLLATRKLYP